MSWRSLTKIEDPDPHPVRFMDPLMRIRTKISWIRNTAFSCFKEWYVDRRWRVNCTACCAGLQLSCRPCGPRSGILSWRRAARNSDGNRFAIQTYSQGWGSGSAWIRINLNSWIQIQTQVKNFYFLKSRMFSFEGSPAAWASFREA